MPTMKTILVDVLARRTLVLERDRAILEEHRQHRLRELTVVAGLCGVTIDVTRQIVRIEKETANASHP